MSVEGALESDLCRWRRRHEETAADFRALLLQIRDEGAQSFQEGFWGLWQAAEALDPVTAGYGEQFGEQWTDVEPSTSALSSAFHLVLGLETVPTAEVEACTSARQRAVCPYRAVSQRWLLSFEAMARLLRDEHAELLEGRDEASLEQAEAARLLFSTLSGPLSRPGTNAMRFVFSPEGLVPMRTTPYGLSEDAVEPHASLEDCDGAWGVLPLVSLPLALYVRSTTHLYEMLERMQAVVRERQVLVTSDDKLHLWDTSAEKPKKVKKVKKMHRSISKQNSKDLEELEPDEPDPELAQLQDAAKCLQELLLELQRPSSPGDKPLAPRSLRPSLVSRARFGKINFPEKAVAFRGQDSVRDISARGVVRGSRLAPLEPGAEALRATFDRDVRHYSYLIFAIMAALQELHLAKAQLRCRFPTALLASSSPDPALACRNGYPMLGEYDFPEEQLIFRGVWVDGSEVDEERARFQYSFQSFSRHVSGMARVLSFYAGIEGSNASRLAAKHGHVLIFVARVKWTDRRCCALPVQLFDGPRERGSELEVLLPAYARFDLEEDLSLSSADFETGDGQSTEAAAEKLVELSRRWDGLELPDMLLEMLRRGPMCSEEFPELERLRPFVSVRFVRAATLPEPLMELFQDPSLRLYDFNLAPMPASAPFAVSPRAVRTRPPLSPRQFR